MGLLERIRRRGDDSPEAAPAAGDPTTAWAPEAGPSVPPSDAPTTVRPAPAAAAEPPTVVQPTPPGGLWHDTQPHGGEPVGSVVPAGAEPADPLRATRPSFLDRGRLRRRLRYLRRVRELGFRDLGGLVFDQHRFDVRRPDLVDGKLQALAAVDRELRALERALGDRREFIDLREPGIAACPRCSALHGSDARFCPACGLRLSGPRAFAEVAEGPQVVDPEAGVVEPPPPPPPEPEMAAPVEEPTQVLVVEAQEPQQPTERIATVEGDAAGAPESAQAEVTPAGPGVPGGDSADPLPEDDRADARREA